MERLHPAVLWLTGALLLACGSAQPAVSSLPPVVTGGVVIPLPPLPGSDSDAPRPEPLIRNLAEAEAALDAGFYRAVAAAIGSNPSLRGLTPRLKFETGEYEEVIALLADSSAPSDLLRVSEALSTLGRIDDAIARVRALAETSPLAQERLAALLTAQGKTAEASVFFRRVIRSYNDEQITNRDAMGLLAVARSAHALGSPSDANDAFTEALRAASTPSERAAINLDWATLFLENYDAGHAEECLQDILQQNPEHPQALERLARVRLEQTMDLREATTLCERALATHPRLAAAQVTLAGVAIRNGDLARAEEAIAAALAVHPTHLEALATRAALALLRGDEAAFGAIRDAVFAVNRHDTQFYQIVAAFAEWEHRYPEIVEMMNDALTRNPSDAKATATLGLNLLRQGREEEGLTALREAWRRDRFNVRTYNTLNLFEDVLAPHYQSFTAGPFVFRVHEEERSILEHYLPARMTRPYQHMVSRYAFTPEGPLHIELFADPEHFSVRTSGLPRIGVQGVCFGKLITAISPHSAQFNWAEILWHELAHVFHIQMSRGRVPRWFTEGLAEYEANIANSHWKRELDHELARALREDSLPHLGAMNQAFTNARSERDVVAAYYASTRAIHFLVERFGFSKIPLLLRAFGADQSVEQAFQSVLGMSAEDLDRDFREHERVRLGTRMNDFEPDLARYSDLSGRAAAAETEAASAEDITAYAAALLQNGDAEQAQTQVDRALARDSRFPLGLWLKALLLSHSDGDARAPIAALLALGKEGYALRLMQARAALAHSEIPVALEALRLATARDPERTEAWQGLLELATEAHDEPEQERVRLQLAELDEHNGDLALALLTEAYERQDMARVVVLHERALQIAPHQSRVHIAGAEALLATRQLPNALGEAEAAVLSANPQERAAALGVRARVHSALGHRSDARSDADAALALDPSLAPSLAAIR